MPFGYGWGQLIFRGGVTLAITGTVTIVVEHICAVNKWERRPSIALNTAATKCTNAWEWVGRQWAWISTWPRHLHLDELFENAWAVIAPAGKLVFSPLWTLKGYGAQIKEFYLAYPGTVHVGSILLLTFLLGGAWYTGLLSKCPWIARMSGSLNPLNLLSYIRAKN